MTTINEGAERPRRSAEQGQALVEQWRQSGQTVAAYCRQPGTVAGHTLRYWITREKPSKSLDGKEGDFFVVSTPTDSEQSPRQPATELKYKPLPRGGADSPVMRNAIIVVLPLMSVRGLAQAVQALIHEGLS